MDHGEIFALVSILLRDCLCYERQLQRLEACGVSNKDLKSSGHEYFLVMNLIVASAPSFLFVRQCSRDGFDLTVTCSSGVSLGPVDMFLSRQDANAAERLQDCA